MLLFDDKVRTERALREEQSEFDYLNDSSRPVINRIRTTLEEWFSHYPEPKQARLRYKFRDRPKRGKSLPDIEFRSAFFELLVHELLCCLGYHVEVEPFGVKEEGPDFLAESNNVSFYVEATVQMGLDYLEAEAVRKEEVLLRQIDTLPWPRVQVDVKIRGEYPTKLAIDTIVAHASEHLAEMSRTTEGEGATDSRQISNWVSDINGEDPHASGYQKKSTNPWTIRFSSRLRNRATQEVPGRRIIRHVTRSYAPLLGSLSPIWDGFADKAPRYGKRLDRPYVVAINNLSVGGSFDSPDDAIEQLFSLSYNELDRIVVVDEVTDTPRLNEAPDEGELIYMYNHHRANAALIVNAAEPGILYSACVFYNPGANQPLGAVEPLVHEFPRRAKVALSDGMLQLSRGSYLKEILGLRPEWPLD